MYLKALFVVIFISSVSAQKQQQIRPLPNAAVNINCGQLTVLRTTGLISPATTAQLPEECTYRIFAINAFICQIRFDFRSFNLGQPTTDVTGYPQCNNDAFTVGNVTLCGENTGQHIYVPINPLAGEKEIQVRIRLASRNSGLVRPSWNIVVNQFECPLGMGRSLKNDDTSVKSTETEMPISRSPRTVFSDWLAPPNCLQYYPEASGQIESFNFGNGAGPYIGNMNYAICFRRNRDQSTIRFFATVFQMSQTGQVTGEKAGLDDDCLSQIPTIGQSEDYVMIPNARLDNPEARATRFCGNSLLSRNVFSSPPHPFMLVVNTDSVYDPRRSEIGFRISYQIS
jgi:hypothetical protein